MYLHTPSAVCFVIVIEGREVEGDFVISEFDSNDGGGEGVADGG
jgi:hypothetical protein